MDCKRERGMYFCEFFSKLILILYYSYHFVYWLCAEIDGLSWCGTKGWLGLWLEEKCRSLERSLDRDLTIWCDLPQPWPPSLIFSAIFFKIISKILFAYNFNWPIILFSLFSHIIFEKRWTCNLIGGNRKLEREYWY